MKARHSDSNCGGTEGKLDGRKGGKAYIPSVPSSGNFLGEFKYAPLSKKGNYYTYFTSCVYDFANIPVPSGYLYDWFGEWRIGGGNGLSFVNASLSGELQANVWVKHRAYYLFLYSSAGQLIESYSIGPLAENGDLNFTSPFENGLAVTSPFELEIAHPAKQ